MWHTKEYEDTSCSYHANDDDDDDEDANSDFF